MTQTSTIVERVVVPVGRGPVQLCLADAGNTVVALASGSALVTLLDGRTAEVRATIDVGDAPWNALARHALVYVMADTVQVLDATAGRIVATIELPPGSRPKNAVSAFERDRLYSLNTGNGTVSEIDLTSNCVVQTLDVGAGPQYGQRRNGMLFVANGESNDLAVIDESTFTVRSRIKVGRGPERCVIHKDYAQVYTNNLMDDTISIVDVASESLVATVEVEHEPFRITPWDSRARNEWAVLCRGSGDHGGSIMFIDSDTHQVTDSVELSGTVANWNWGLGPRHQRVYVALANEPVLLDIDAGSLAMVGGLKLSGQPEPAGYGPGIVVSSGGGVFVACEGAVMLLTE